MSQGFLDTIRTYVTPTKSEKQRKLNKESEQITEAWRAELLALEDAINKRIDKKKKGKKDCGS